MSESAAEPSPPRVPLRRLLRWGVGVTGARPLHYVPTLAASFLGATLDGAAMALLIPLSDGIAQGSFAELWSKPGFSHVQALLPSRFGPEHFDTGSMFLLLIGIIFTLLLLQSLVQYAGINLAFWRDSRYHVHMQTALLERYLGFGKAYFDAQSAAHVNTVMGYGAQVVRVLDLAERFVSNLLRGGALFAVMIGISGSMTAVLIGISPVLYLVLNGVVKRVNSIADGIKDNELESSRKLYNVLATIPLVKAYGREPEAVDDYHQLLVDRRVLTLARLRRTEIVGPLQTVVGFLALLALAAFAVLRAQGEGTAELSRFCAFLIVARRALPTFEAFGHLRVNLADARPQLEKLAEALEDEDKSLVPNGDLEMPPLQDRIELVGLDFAYREGNPTLRKLSFEALAGQTTALIGASGCGKSTVAALLLRLYDCPPGAIRFDGTDLRAFDHVSLRRRMTLVTQEVVLFHGTLRDNLTYGLDARPRDAQLAEVLGQVQLGGLLDELPKGLDTVVGERGVMLSGGQRQRVSLARALLRDPDVLILDEATSALDSENERAIQQTLDAARAGKTTIVIAHRLATVKNAHQIVVMEAGEVVERGDHRALLAADGRYAAMWSAQDETPLASAARSEEALKR